MKIFIRNLSAFLGVVCVQAMAHAEPSYIIDTTRCKARIPQTTCFVTELNYGSAKNHFELRAAELALSCLPDSSTYAARIEEEFDRLPPVAQEAFCHIERILIPKQGFYWGGRAEVLLEPLNAHEKQRRRG